MDHQFDALLIYGGYSIWPSDDLDPYSDDFPGPPEFPGLGTVVAIDRGAFVLCVGDDTGSDGDVHFEVRYSETDSDQPSGVSDAGQFELQTQTGSVTFTSFDLEEIGSVEVTPGRHRVQVQITPLNEAETGIETHLITVRQLG